MELIVRTVVIFLALWLAMRVAGKREVAQMDAFDLVTIIVLGGLVTQGILQEDYSAVSAIVSLGLVTLLSVGLSWLGWRPPGSEHSSRAHRRSWCATANRTSRR